MIVTCDDNVHIAAASLEVPSYVLVDMAMIYYWRYIGCLLLLQELNNGRCFHAAKPALHPLSPPLPSNGLTTTSSAC